jgi:hypothetical protein
MVKNILIKITTGIFLIAISIIYFKIFNYLLLGRPLPFSFLQILIASLLLVFVYPYIKINTQSLLKRGLFFGTIAWVIDLPRIIMDLRHTLLMFSIPRLLLFIRTPLYFIILGLLIGFCYKKFLTIEFNLSLRRLDIPFGKIILAVILATLIYSFLMLSSEFLIFIRVQLYKNITEFITNLLSISFINPFIFSLVLVLFYTLTLRRIEVSRSKKWVLFSLFVFFFTSPIILSFKEAIAQSFSFSFNS